MEFMTPHNVMWPNPEAESVVGRQQLLHHSRNSRTLWNLKTRFHILTAMHGQNNFKLISAFTTDGSSLYTQEDTPKLHPLTLFP
jgi:hypothetical protein